MQQNYTDIMTLLHKGAKVPVNKRRFQRSALLAYVLLVVLVAVPCVRTWQQVRQERINHALYQAVEQGNTQQVRVLLNAGADPNARERSAEQPHGIIAWLRWMFHHTPGKASGDSALMQASWKGQEDIVRLLMEAGADVNASNQDESGIVQTALSSALYSQEAHIERIIGMLLEAGANPDMGGSLIQAVFDKDAKIVNLMLAHRANFDNHSTETRTLAFDATYNPDAGVMKALLDKGVRTDIPVREGSLLISASQTGNVAVVKLLQSGGAAINFKDENETTALQWAEIQKRRDLARGATKQSVAGYDATIAFLKAHGGRDE